MGIVEECKKIAAGELLYLVRTGSHAYGLATPESDEDFRGIYVPKIKYLLGLHSKDHVEKKDPDIVLKSLQEFVSLAQDANPNILEQLFISDPLYVHPLFQDILDAKHLFLSQRVRRTYVGYALAQLKRMQNGRTRDLGAKRKILRDKFGYDTKNAMHCIRLLKQGKAILMTGDIPVMLPDKDREYLMSIRRGEAFKTIDEITEVAMSMVEEVDNMDSAIPKLPDYDKIEELSINIHLDAIGQGIIKVDDN